MRSKIPICQHQCYFWANSHFHHSQARNKLASFSTGRISRSKLTHTRTLMEDFKPNFTEKIELEYRDIKMSTTPLALSDNQDSDAGKNDEFLSPQCYSSRNFPTRTLVEEFNFAWLENREFESKHINYRSHTVVQNYSKFDSKTLVELTSCYILLWWMWHWELWRKVILIPAESKINVTFWLLSNNDVLKQKKVDKL